jgi:hypothetical protein
MSVHLVARLNHTTTNIWPKGTYTPLKLWKWLHARLIADGGLDWLHALSRADLSHNLSAMEIRWHAARQRWLLAVIAGCIQPSTSSCRDMSPTMQCRLAGEQSGVTILADRQVEGSLRAHPSCYKGRGSTWSSLSVRWWATLCLMGPSSLQDPGRCRLTVQSSFDVCCCGGVLIVQQLRAKA